MLGHLLLSQPASPLQDHLWDAWTWFKDLGWLLFFSCVPLNLVCVCVFKNTTWLKYLRSKYLFISFWHVFWFAAKATENLVQAARLTHLSWQLQLSLNILPISSDAWIWDLESQATKFILRYLDFSAFKIIFNSFLMEFIKFVWWMDKEFIPTFVDSWNIIGSPVL